MITKSGNITPRQSKGDDDDIDLREISIKYISQWPLFVVSVIIALAIAFVVYKIKKPAYEIKATLVMQDNKDKTTEEKSALQELDLVNPPKIVENEIEILKSRQLTKSVVERLQLWATYSIKDNLTISSYKIKDNFITNDLYGITPVKFNLNQAAGPILQQKLKVNILDADSYLLTDGDNGVTKHRFGDTINSQMGSWTITGTDNLKAYIGKTILISLVDPELTIQSYLKSLNVILKDKLASAVELSISDPNAKRGEDYINNLIYYYNQAEIAEKNNLTKSTIAFIDTRLDSLRGELNSAEGKVEGYRSKKGLTNIDAQSHIYLQDVQANGARLNEINIQLNIINGLERYVNLSGNTDHNIPSISGISDQILVGLVQKLSDLQLEKTKLLATLPERNPAFESLNNQIASTKFAIKENIRNIKSSLLATKQELQSFKSNFQSSIQSVPGQERQLAGLNRQQSIKENLYTYLLQKREQISLSYASSLSNARLVDVAYALPLSGSKKLVPFGVAIVIGLVFPAGLIYGKDKIKNNISKRKEIEIATSIPIVAEFNYIKLPSGIVSDSKNNELNFTLLEQFRCLRTQLVFLNQSVYKGKVTLITSSMMSEGKSFISSNLAVSLANSGKRTILLEMDIYKPKISNIFNLSESLGLSDYLKGKYSKEDIIQKSQKYQDLYFIGCGTFIDNFSELLGQRSFQDLLNELRANYDHILIDTPPLHAINDANIIAKLCDVTLYVVRYNHTSKSLLPFIQKLHTDKKLPKMNIVFNGLVEGRDGEGYKYEKYHHSKLPA